MKIFFKSIERKISDLYGDKLVLIKSSHGHSKVYVKLFVIEGKIQTPIRFLLNGKKKIANPLNFIGVPFFGKIVMRISKIYSGSCLSLICEAKEVLIEKIQTKENSYYDVLGAELNYLWNKINTNYISEEAYYGIDPDSKYDE